MDRPFTGALSHVRDTTDVIEHIVLLRKDRTVNDAQQKKDIRKTAIILTLIALTFYGGFILLGVLRS